MRLCGYETEQLFEVVRAWDDTVEEGLKRYDGTTYVNKMHLLFGSPSHKNYEVKRA